MTSTAPSAALVVEGAYELAEGGRWFDGRYMYVDILGGRLSELRDARDARDDTGPTELARLDVPLGAVAPVHGRPDTWIAAAGTGIALLTPDGALEWLDRPEDRTPVPSRMNDGGAAPPGASGPAAWPTTAPPARAPSAARTPTARWSASSTA